MFHTQKMKTGYLIILTILLLTFFLPLSQSVNADGREVNGVYFFVSLCNNCAEVEKALETIDNKLRVEMPDITLNIKHYNINDNESLELLYKYCEYYKVPKDKQDVPILFISDRFYQDADEILNEIPKLLQSGNLEETPILVSSEIKKDFSIADIANIILAGFLNGLNPCSLSMLLYFFSIIMTRKAEVLKMGLSFIAGKFIAYLLLGTLFYSTLSAINGEYYKVLLKGLFVIFAAVLIYLNLKDFFTAKKEDYKNIKNQLPMKLRAYNHKLISKFVTNRSGVVLVLLSFILGLVISVGEFLCTGQIYVATMVYMLKSSTSLSITSFISLILYDLAFIIPPLLITILIAKGTNIFDISEILRSKLPLIKLFNALIILAFCILAIIFI